MANPERQFSCGECRHFSTNTVDDKSYGTVSKNGEEIEVGVCRTNCGLIFGPREATAPCIQPEGIFEPSERKLDETPPGFEENGIEVASFES